LSSGLCFIVATSISAHDIEQKSDGIIKARLSRLKQLASGKILMPIRLKSLSLCVSQPRNSSAGAFEWGTLYNDPIVGLEARRISKRVEKLLGTSNLEPNSFGQSSVTLFGPQKYYKGIYEMQVQAFEVFQTNGTMKYFAVAPLYPNLSVSTTNKPVVSQEYRLHDSLKRSDFINPEDIDWFFGVKDFSTYRHD
jgi:hypothetical protein